LNFANQRKHKRKNPHKIEGRGDSLNFAEVLKVKPKDDSKRHQVGQLRKQTAKRETNLICYNNL
jgi:hypothetical protein